MTQPNPSPAGLTAILGDLAVLVYEANQGVKNDQSWNRGPIGDARRRLCASLRIGRNDETADEITLKLPAALDDACAATLDEHAKTLGTAAPPLPLSTALNLAHEVLTAQDPVAALDALALLSASIRDQVECAWCAGPATLNDGCTVCNSTAVRKASRVVPDQLRQMVFAEVIAWHAAHGGGGQERDYTDRAIAVLPAAAHLGVTKARRYQLITDAVARVMTDGRGTSQDQEESG